jgi:hypothetical protein
MITLWIKGTNNWISTIPYLLGLTNEVMWESKYLGKIKLTKNDKWAIVLFIILTEHEPKVKEIVFQRNEKILEIDIGRNHGKVKILNKEINLISETFGLEPYHVENNDSEEKSVIDMGVNREDSTLYFVSKGYKVIAFEPISMFKIIYFEHHNVIPYVDLISKL